MPPVIDSTRDLYFLDYDDLFNQHTVQIGVVPGTPTATVQNWFGNLVQALLPVAYPSTEFRGLRRKAAGSNVSLPINWTAVGGSGAGTPVGENAPRFVSFVGRSDAGKRIRMYFYGLQFVEQDDYRLEPDNPSWVATVLTAIRAGTGFIVARGGNGVLWNDYANWGYNSYYQRKQR